MRGWLRMKFYTLKSLYCWGQPVIPCVKPNIPPEPTWAWPRDWGNTTSSRSMGAQNPLYASGCGSRGVFEGLAIALIIYLWPMVFVGIPEAKSSIYALLWQKGRWREFQPGGCPLFHFASTWTPNSLGLLMLGTFVNTIAIVVFTSFF